jgi:hypothetical protein
MRHSTPFRAGRSSERTVQRLEGLGHYRDPQTQKVFGYLWLDGVFGPDLQVPGADETYPIVITPSGVIGGYLWYVDPTHGLQQRGFIATPSRR